MFWRALLFLGMAVGIGAAFWAPAANGFSKPELARIIFFHLPEAIACSLFFFAAAYFSLRYLMDKSPHWDQRSRACIEIAFVLGILTLATGIIFSRVQWLAWWGWDPRQNSFLFVMLLVGATFALRSAFADEAKAATAVAAYVLVSLIPILFLIFVYPYLPSTVSLHPKTNLTLKFDPIYKVVEYTVFVMLLSTSIWIYKLSVRALLLESELEKLNGELADRDGSAATGVVRPISLPPEGG